MARLQDTIMNLCHRVGKVRITDGVVYVSNIHGQHNEVVSFTVPTAISKAETPTAIGKFDAIVQRFNNAALRMKYPKLYLMLGEHDKLKLQRAGGSAAFPGSINILHGDSWLGRIHTDGKLQFKRDVANKVRQQVLESLHNFMDNPKQAAKIYGQKYGYCCFCQRELVEQSSVYLGYGPVCAEKWGLPHGQTGTFDMSREIDFSVDELQREMELDDHA